MSFFCVSTNVVMCPGAFIVIIYRDFTAVFRKQDKDISLARALHTRLLCNKYCFSLEREKEKGKRQGRVSVADFPTAD